MAPFVGLILGVILHLKFQHSQVSHTFKALMKDVSYTVQSEVQSIVNKANFMDETDGSSDETHQPKMVIQDSLGPWPTLDAETT